MFEHYCQVGFLHVLPWGYDHVLLIMALFLSDDNFKRTLLRSALFTLAHSLTLALAYFKFFELNVPLVETLIALSIFLYAIQLINEKVPKLNHAYTLFVFGLLHGMGFATALSTYHYDLNGQFTALIGFNLGVELAQLCILCCLFFGFKWLCKKQPLMHSKWRYYLLIGIATIGLILTIQRCLLLF